MMLLLALFSIPGSLGEVSTASPQLGQGAEFYQNILPDSAPANHSVPKGEEQLLGLVQDGKFMPLNSSFALPIRLTSIQMMEARSPESGELNLTGFEGEVIMVSGRGGGGGWVYSARVIDRAGPILTAVALRVFGQEKGILAGSG
jgi:hypothetical protein